MAGRAYATGSQLFYLAVQMNKTDKYEKGMQVRASQKTGTSPEDIMEAMLHVAIYCGVSKANYAIKIVKQTLSDLKND